MVTTMSTSMKVGTNVVDFVAYKAERETEEYMSWARHWSMMTGNTDFSDPEFWEDIEELVRESFDELA